MSPQSTDHNPVEMTEENTFHKQPEVTEWQSIDRYIVDFINTLRTQTFDYSERLQRKCYIAEETNKQCVEAYQSLYQRYWISETNLSEMTGKVHLLQNDLAEMTSKCRMLQKEADSAQTTIFALEAVVHTHEQRLGNSSPCEEQLISCAAELERKSPKSNEASFQAAGVTISAEELTDPAGHPGTGKRARDTSDVGEEVVQPKRARTRKSVKAKKLALANTS